MHCQTFRRQLTKVLRSKRSTTNSCAVDPRSFLSKLQRDIFPQVHEQLSRSRLDAHTNFALGWMKILSHPPFAIEFPMPGLLSHLTSPTHQQDAEGANDIYRILNTCKEWNDRKYLQHRVASRNSNECKCSLLFYGAKTHLIRRFISEASDENLLNVRCAFQL